MNFPPASEAQSESQYADIPDGTEVEVRIRLNDDGEIEPRTGTGRNGKPWSSYSFAVHGGEFDGRWLSLMLTMDPANFYFRRDVSMITGINLDDGGRVDTTLFNEALRSGIFKVKVETRKKEGKSYVNVTEILERRDAPAEASPQIGGAADEEDIPF
ncbi:hypothetical protein [Miltoncostaea oceani]|uniref:hypothetical protein n=1 Tax=Miltoncostaea oceani TaxID=2843216 RepID=UPI001C3C435B|nr:hypothetical protein [Miltoncostaea oceani]